MKLLTTFKLNAEDIKEMEKSGVQVTVFDTNKDLIQSKEVENADAIIADHRTLRWIFLRGAKI